MNCANLLENLGFTCAPRKNGALRLWSPFTFDDGEHIGLFLEPIGHEQWLVTDHCDTLMHSGAIGAKITKNRLNHIRQRYPAIELTEGGALRAVSSTSQLSTTVAAVLNTAIAISHNEQEWVPKTKEEQFTKSVGRELKTVAGELLQSNIAVHGVSGHQIEIPFVIDLPNTGRHYIQPVASKDNGIDWSNIYRAGGKMLDLKSAGINDHQRLVVIEDLPNDEELGKAVTFLSVTTSVLLFSHKDQWLPTFRKVA
jgi:hypothetical protein